AGDDEARVRAAVALAHALLGAAGEAKLRALAEAALSRTEDWLRCPCPAHMLHALEAWRAVAPADPGRVRANPDVAAELLRRAVAAIERHGLGSHALAHLRVTWLPWLVAAAAR